MNDAKPDVASLPAKWRKTYEMHGLEWDAGYNRARHVCADELEAALPKPASGDGLPADDGETLRLLDARKDDALCREAADLIRRLTTPSQPGSAVQGEADEAAMEAWHSAVEEAGELYVNAPDSRYANRARRVKAWIVSQRPRVHRSGN